MKKFFNKIKTKIRRPSFFKTGLVLTTISCGIALYGFKYYIPCNDVQRRDEIPAMTYPNFTAALENAQVEKVYLDNSNKFYYTLIEQPDFLYETDNPGYEEFRLDLLNKGIIIEPKDEVQTADEIESSRKGGIITFIILTGCPAFVYLILGLTEKGDNNPTVPIANKKALAGGGPGSSSSNTQSEKKPGQKTFDDIAGLKEVKRDMKCLVDFMVNKEKYLEAGAKLPKGVILYGPPGTGKTLIAKAIAGEADVPFLFMSGSDFIETYVGVGAKRVRELFATARKHAPCIIFIDEIDAIGGKRHANDNGEDRKTINAILTEMDGFNESDNILVIAATNRLEDLDDALTRPGRFTDQFCVPLPETVADRMEIIKIYAKNKKLSDDINIKALAKEMIGFSPAKIEAVLNEAAIISVQDHSPVITKAIVDKAMYKIMLHGHMKEDNSERSQEELELVAWHEAGHALVGALFGKDITKVTIISSTSGAGGVTFSAPKKQGLHSIEDIKHEVMELYAGRIGELLLYNENHMKVTTGASNDIERATGIIHEYVTRYGMSETFGMLKINDEVMDKKQVMNMEIQLAKELEQATIELMKAHFDDLKQIAEELIERETIYRPDIDRIVRKKIVEPAIEVSSITEEAVSISLTKDIPMRKYKCMHCHKTQEIDKRLLKKKAQMVICPTCKKKNLLLNRP